MKKLERLLRDRILQGEVFRETCRLYNDQANKNPNDILVKRIGHHVDARKDAMDRLDVMILKEIERLEYSKAQQAQDLLNLWSEEDA